MELGKPVCAVPLGMANLRALCMSIGTGPGTPEGQSEDSGDGGCPSQAYTEIARLAEVSKAVIVLLEAGGFKELPTADTDKTPYH